MSNEDISMVCNVLLGITNPDKEVRTQSENKLQELSNNLGALTFCFIEIASKPATNDKEKIIKTTALVIGRKILDRQKDAKWKEIDAQLKQKIKTNILNLLNSELDPGQNSKICDFITVIMEKVLDSEEEWPELFTLVFSIYNYDPSDNSKVFQIQTLLKLLIGGTGYMYMKISEQFNNFIPYLVKLLDSQIDMKIKALAAEFICELISFCEDEEIKIFKEAIRKVVQNIGFCYDMKEKMPEDCVKKFLDLCINAETIEPTLFSPYFSDIFKLGQALIAKKDYDDEKIRELAFEFILNLIEEKPSLFKSKKKDSKLLLPFLEMAFSYALEFDKENDQSWATPTGNNYDSNNIEDSTDEKICFALSVIDRTIECMGIDDTEKELKSILEGYLKNSWEYQYFAFYVLGNYSKYDQDMSKVEKIFPILFNSTSSPQPKLRFSALHCINVFCDLYSSSSFESTYIKELIPLLENILKKETILRIQCEIISTLISLIQFTTNDDLKPYVKELFDLLFTLFKQNNIPLIIRKLVLEAILEIISTMEEDISPYASVAFDIILNYFVEVYKNKQHQILYGVLIECITSLGIYIKEKYFKVIPDIVNCIVEIVKGFNSEKMEPIRADLTNSLDRLLDVLKDNFKNLLPNLIETVLALVRLRPKMSISSTPDEQFDIKKILEEEEEEDPKMKGQEIQTSETEELASSLSLLNTFVKSIGSGFLPYYEKVESEVIELISYKLDSKIRSKSSKILPNLLQVITNQESKIKKGKEYLRLLIGAIEKESSYYVTKKLFIHLREVIENCGQFLNKNELNELFAKINTYIHNLKEKRENLSNKKSKLKKHNDDDEDDLNIQDLIQEDIENIENTQIEISDCIGILLKTHKQLSDEIISKLLKEIIPSFASSKNVFEVKMGLFISDDLIEYIGQEMLGDENWNLMFKIISQLVLNKDNVIRQAAAYGIGNFARSTTRNFDNYSKELIDSLYKAMNIKEEKKDNGEENDDEEYNAFGMSFDNIVSALGKIINYQFNSKIVQAGLNELINKWIMNLPIVYDKTEMEIQHQWLVDLFLTRRQLINENCYNHYFETLGKIYETKSSNDKLNEKIKNIFNEYVKKEDKLKQIVDKIYQNGDESIKKKLEKLII